MNLKIQMLPHIFHDTFFLVRVTFQKYTFKNTFKINVIYILI